MGVVTTVVLRVVREMSLARALRITGWMLLGWYACAMVDYALYARQRWGLVKLVVVDHLTWLTLFSLPLVLAQHITRAPLRIDPLRPEISSAQRLLEPLRTAYLFLTGAAFVCVGAFLLVMMNLEPAGEPVWWLGIGTAMACLALGASIFVLTARHSPWLQARLGRS